MSDTSEALPWTPPSFDLSQLPNCAFTTTLPSTKGFPHDFARKVKWCPDGSIALVQCESRSFRFLDIPSQILTPQKLPLRTSNLRLSIRSLLNLSPKVAPLNAVQPARSTFPQSAPILDFAWYPSATTYNPASFCFAASVRECPVKLLDANDGRLRASYKIVDHRERYVAPHSVAFTPIGDKLFCGFEDAIEVFSVHQPGEGTRLHTTPSKKTKDGLKGIISSLAFPLVAEPSYFVASSLLPATSSSPNIALIATEGRGTPFAYLEGGPKGKGATQVKIVNDGAGEVVYATFRGENGIWCWDVRGDCSVPTRVLHPSKNEGDENGRRRKRLTNQRMWFDVDAGARWLARGDEDGWVEMYDLHARAEPTLDPITGTYSSDVVQQASVLRYRAHQDGIGGVAFHPLRAALLSVSGSRHFTESHEGTATHSDSSDSDTSNDEDATSPSSSRNLDLDILDIDPCHNDKNGDGKRMDQVGPVMPLKEAVERTHIRIRRTMRTPLTWDASVKLWGFDGSVAEDARDIHSL